MSSIVNKVKEVLHSDKDNKQTHDTTTTGAHNSRLNEPRVDSQHDARTSALHSGTTGTAGTTGYTTSDNYATGPASSTAGPHSSNIANKADPRVDSDLDGRNRVGGAGVVGGDATHSRTTGPASSTAGPHSSNIANKADPRVDSDLDSRNRVGGAGTGSGFGAGVGAGDATHSYTTGPASSTAGPHSSNIANKADPRVDSDLDSRNRVGGAGGAGVVGGDATHSRTTGPASNTAGPHSSNIANKADPRVDSDLDGRSGGYNTRSAAAAGATGGAVGGQALHGQQYNTTTGSGGLDTTGSGLNTTTGTSGAGYGTGNTLGSTGTHGATGTHHGHHSGVSGTTGHTGPHGTGATTGLTGATGTSGLTGTTGHTGTHGTTGHHTSGVAGTHGTTGHHSTTGQHGTAGSTVGGGLNTTPGPAPNTAGPHKSDMLNKIDPRVDSDLDGSKTVGGNNTYARS